MLQEMNRRSTITTGIAALSAVALANDARAQTPSIGSPEQRLRELGIELPQPPGAVANYVPAARMGNLIFLAGVGPVKPDRTMATGKVGKDVSLDEAYQHARFCGLVLLAVMRQAAGNLDNVMRIGKVFGMGCRRESGRNSGDAISERMKLPPHAARSIG